MRVSVVVGNPKSESRTLHVAEAVAAAVAGVTGLPRGLTVDLAPLAGSLFTWPHDELDGYASAIARSTVVVVASPTYKASYTGMLKAFLDRYGNGGLASVVAVPVMTGASVQHSLAPDVHLRPLLVELGASVPTSALYFPIDRIDELDAVVGAWTEANGPALAGLRFRAEVRP